MDEPETKSVESDLSKYATKNNFYYEVDDDGYQRGLYYKGEDDDLTGKGKGKGKEKKEEEERNSVKVDLLQLSDEKAKDMMEMLESIESKEKERLKKEMKKATHPLHHFSVFYDDKLFEESLNADKAHVWQRKAGRQLLSVSVMEASEDPVSSIAVVDVASAFYEKLKELRSDFTFNFTGLVESEVFGSARHTARYFVGFLLFCFILFCPILVWFGLV